MPKGTDAAESLSRLRELRHSKKYLDMFPGLYYLYD